MSTELLTVFLAVQINLCAHSGLPVVIIQAHLHLLPVIIFKLCNTSTRDEMIEDLPPSVTSKLYFVKLATHLSQWPSWFCTFDSFCYENLSFRLSPCSGGTATSRAWCHGADISTMSEHTSLSVKEDHCSHWSSGQLSQKNMSLFLSS